MKGKDKKTATIIIVILVVVIITYFVYQNRVRISQAVNGTSSGGSSVDNSSSSVSQVTDSSSPSSSVPTNTCSEYTILKRGASCENEVFKAQREINKVWDKIGLSKKLTEDGDFGSKTEAAFMELLGEREASLFEVETKVDFVDTWAWLYAN